MVPLRRRLAARRAARGGPRARSRDDDPGCRPRRRAHPRVRPQRPDGGVRSVDRDRSVENGLGCAHSCHPARPRNVGTPPYVGTIGTYGGTMLSIINAAEMQFRYESEYARARARPARLDPGTPCRRTTLVGDVVARPSPPRTPRRSPRATPRAAWPRPIGINTCARPPAPPPDGSAATRVETRPSEPAAQTPPPPEPGERRGLGQLAQTSSSVSWMPAVVESLVEAPLRSGRRTRHRDRRGSARRCRRASPGSSRRSARARAHPAPLRGAGVARRLVVHRATDTGVAAAASDGRRAGCRPG